MNIEDLVSELKQRQTVIRLPDKPKKRKQSRKGRGYKKADFTPEAYRRKVERDKAVWKGVSGTWKHLRKTYASRARKRGTENLWQITLEQWWSLWRAAGYISTQTGSIPIFKLRGKHKDCARVWRIDQEKPWILDNMVVIYRGQIRANGRAITSQFEREAKP